MIECLQQMEDFGKTKEGWLRTFLELPNGIPSHDTFNRVFSAIDPVHSVHSVHSVHPDHPVHSPPGG